MNGVGGKLGPDLGGSWRNGLSYFLENIVDPNAVVGEAYQLSVITKRDGSVLSGIVDSETDTSASPSILSLRGGHRAKDRDQGPPEIRAIPHARRAP